MMGLPPIVYRACAEADTANKNTESAVTRWASGGRDDDKQNLQWEQTAGNRSCKIQGSAKQLFQQLAWRKIPGEQKGGISCNRTEIRGFNHPESFEYTKLCQLTAVLNLYYFLCLFKLKPDKTVFCLKNFKYWFKYTRQMFTVLFFKTAKEIKMYKKSTISSNDSIQMSVCLWLPPKKLSYCKNKHFTSA